MLRRWMHYLEHRHFLRDNNRLVRPFEWGEEFLNGHTSGNDPRDAVHKAVEKALANSDGFFAYATPDKFQQEGDRVFFQSPVRTPYRENNTASFRYFPAPGSKRAVVVMPQWNAQPESHLAFCRFLSTRGINAARLTLPYHEDRNLPELERAEYLISPNVGRTIQAVRQAVTEVRAVADWFQQQGMEKIGVAGTSIGSCIAFLTYTHDTRFKCVVLNHSSSHFAEVVWEGMTTNHVRAGIEQRLGYDEIAKLWSVISPISYVRRLASDSRPRLRINCDYDLTFKPEMLKTFVDACERYRVSFDCVRFPCGHYTLGSFPFNILDGLVIARYLGRNL